jgi:flagellar basal body-associated protein FliL
MKQQSDCNKKNKGQALVVLLFYMIIAITLSTTAVAVMVSNSLSVTQSEQNIQALEIAEAGAENALVRLLRVTGYTGETLTVGDGSVAVTVSGVNTKTITSVGTIASFSRTIRVTATITNGVLAVTSWSEL